MVPKLLSLLSGAAAFAPAARRWVRSAPRALRGVARAAGDNGLSLRAERLKSLLGEPHNKGGNNVPVWIEYQDKGLQINFKGLSFEVSALSCVRVGAAEMFWLKHEKCD